MAFTHYQRITRHASGRITRDAWTPLQRTQSIDGAIWGETRVTHVSDEVVRNQGFAEALGRVEYRGSDGLVTDLGEVFLRTIAPAAPTYPRPDGTGGARVALRALGCVDWRHVTGPVCGLSVDTIVGACCIDAPDDIPAGSTVPGLAGRAVTSYSTTTQRE